jgi:antitoxin ParD1/3/4
MRLTLTPRLAKLVKEKLTKGLYASEVEVVREAVLLLEARDEYRAIRLEKLRREVARGAREADKGKLVSGARALQDLRTTNRSVRVKRS